MVNLANEVLQSNGGDMHYFCRASDISRGRGPAKFKYFREISQNSQKNAK